MTRAQPERVLVTGGTGRVGRMVIDQLLTTGRPVRALARQPETSDLPDETEVVAGDLAAPESLEQALSDTSVVFLVWTLPFATAPAVVEKLARHRCRVVFLSAPHRTPHPFFQQPNPMAELHAGIEQLIADAGLRSTVVRPGMLASNALNWWAPAVRAGQSIRWPYGAAETAPVDDRDVAAVAARLLVDEDQDGRDYVLTGPESLSQAEQVRIIGDVVGRDVAFEELSPDAFRRETADTWPPSAVEMLLGAWAATMGHPAYLTTAVSDVLGTPARPFARWVRDHAAAFRDGQVEGTGTIEG